MTKKRGRKPVVGVARNERLCLRFTKDEMKLICDLSDFLDIQKSVLLRTLILSQIHLLDKQLIEIFNDHMEVLHDQHF